MAVDTENKRRSVVGILPVPDGVIGSPDYQQVARLYAGIVAYIPQGPYSRLYNVPSEDRVYLAFSKDRDIYNIPSVDRLYQVS